MTRKEFITWMGLAGAILLMTGVALARGWPIVGLVFACIGGAAFGFAIGELMMKRM